MNALKSMPSRFVFLAAALLLAAEAAAAGHSGQPVPVTATTVALKSVPVWIESLGTVLPMRYVSVMPRVAGLLQSLNFREGEFVRAGQVVATIDPRPFQIQLDQAQAQMARDEAQLAGARSDLERYETLLAQDSISSQQVADQRATVGQLAGTVASDKAAVANAKLQLEWTRIVAPCSGVAGLRQVDPGNMIGTNGAIGGGLSSLGGTGNATPPIVTIAQVAPIQVTFPVTQSDLPAVLARYRGRKAMPVEAWDQGRTRLLDTGKVIALDNQINSATGTVTVKAEFPNRHARLYPNQFVNARLRLDTVENVPTVPSAAISSGAPGSFVYVIDGANRVSVRKVVTGASDQGRTAIASGLKAGERVVTDGLDQLREGSAVQVVTPVGKGNASRPK